MGEVDCNELFEALGNVHRRRILLALLETDAGQSAVQVPEDVHTGEQKLRDLQIELIHRHLPRLDDVGYVTWDREDHEVRRGPRFAEIEPVLKLLADHRDELPEDFV